MANLRGPCTLTGSNGLFIASGACPSIRRNERTKRKTSSRLIPFHCAYLGVLRAHWHGSGWTVCAQVGMPVGAIARTSLRFGPSAGATAGPGQPDPAAAPEAGRLKHISDSTAGCAEYICAQLASKSCVRAQLLYLLLDSVSTLAQ